MMNFQPHHVFTDNYFTSLSAAKEFTKRSTALTGTNRTDSIGNSNLMDVSIMEKKPGDFMMCTMKRSIATFCSADGMATPWFPYCLIV